MIDAISRSILGLLRKSPSGLKASDIADLITFSGSDVSRKDVNQRLYGELGDRVVKVDEHRWVLMDLDNAEHAEDSPDHVSGYAPSQSSEPSVFSNQDMGSGIRLLLEPSGLQSVSQGR